jgi:hypothetical protein
MAKVKDQNVGRRGGARTGMVVVNIHIPTAAHINAVPQTVFIADQAYRLVSVEAAWHTNSTGGTILVKKCTGTQAESAGTDMVSEFSDALTKDTVYTATLVTTESSLKLADGDRIVLKETGNHTNLVGACLTIILVPIRDERYWISEM